MGDFSYENLMQYFWLFQLSDCVIPTDKAYVICSRVLGKDVEISAIRDLSEHDQRRLYEWFQDLYGEFDG